MMSINSDLEVQKYTDAYIFVEGDSASVFSASKQKLSIDPSKDYFFIKQSFDLDVMTVVFKYRPATSGLPRQLNTEFNGNAFVGYRVDRFRLKRIQPPLGTKNKINHRGITLG